MPRKNSIASDVVALPATSVHADAALVLRRFRQIFNAVKSHFQQLEKRSGLGGAKIWALSVIEQHPGIGTGALAQAMDIHQSTTSNLVKLLIAHELVQARKSDSDRRSVQLHILPAGKKILKSVPGPFIGVLPDALERLDTATLKHLNRDLSRLTALLAEADEDSALTPLSEI